MIRDTQTETRQKIAAHAELTDKRILELGCGTGRVTETLIGEPRLVIGIEPDLGAVCSATANVPEAHFLCASGMHLPFPDDSFDMVLYTLSLHHHPDCAGALAEARRVLEPTGCIVIIEPTPQSEIQRLCNIFDNEDHKLDRVKKSLARSDLALIAEETFSTQWLFTDFDDVADYAFTYYQHTPDNAKREALRDFLNSKANDAPLRMTDTLRLTCLREG